MMKIEYFSLPNRFSYIFITDIVFICLCYSIEGISPLYGTRKVEYKSVRKILSGPCRYMLVNSFCALSFRALILVGFLLLHLEAIFTSACFFLTAHVSHGTLGLALCLVGMHSAAASKWALTKFSYLSIRVGVSDISWSVLNLFLSVNVYSSQ